MLSINILSLKVNMQLIILLILGHNLSSLHIETNWKNSAQREIRVLDIFSINFFILIQEIRVLELLDWLVSDLGHPVVDTESSILKDHLLEVIEFETLVVISFKIFDKFSKMGLSVHDFWWLVQIQGLDHHFSSGAFLDDKKIEDILSVDLTDHFVDLNVGIDMLCSSSTCEMDKPITMPLALSAKIWQNIIDVLLLQ